MDQGTDCRAPIGKLAGESAGRRGQWERRQDEIIVCRAS